MTQNNVGILAAISWNSNHWKKPATEEDISHSNFAYVKENGWMHEDINFAHEDLPREEDDRFIAYTPMFNKLPGLPESKHVDIVFFRRLNYKANKQYIVGFYAFPSIDKFKRRAKHEVYAKHDSGNVASLVGDIVYFKIPVEISNKIVSTTNYLPKGKKLGQRGFNYMFYDNVLKVLDKATMLNPTDDKLMKIKYRFLSGRKYTGKP